MGEWDVALVAGRMSGLCTPGAAAELIAAFFWLAVAGGAGRAPMIVGNQGHSALPDGRRLHHFVIAAGGSKLLALFDTQMACYYTLVTMITVCPW